MATDPTKPHPWPIEAFVSTHPRTLKFVQDPKPTPVSFATEAFYGNNAFLFINKKGLRQAGRYQILPVAGQHYVTDAEAKSNTSDFLIEELRTHLAQERELSVGLRRLVGLGDDSEAVALGHPIMPIGDGLGS